MNLSEPHFSNMKKKLKTVELRLYDEKRKTIKEGDKIKFKNRNNENQSFTRKVKKLKFFSSFIDALKYTKLKNTLPNVKTYKEGEEVYYSIKGYKEKEKKLGVIAIFF